MISVHVFRPSPISHLRTGTLTTSTCFAHLPSPISHLPSPYGDPHDVHMYIYKIVYIYTPLIHPYVFFLFSQVAASSATLLWVQSISA